MWSQNNEEQFIVEAFGDYVGRFLDIGASDGKTGSNTLALVERGWSGVLVEPSPRAFLKLQELHGDNPKLTLVHAAIGLNPRLEKFWDGPKALGYATTEEGNRAKWEHLCSFQRPFYVASLDLLDFLRQIDNPPFDFLSIDTEGTSVDLFLAYRFPATYPKVLCVEHDGRIPECIERANELRYEEVCRNAENMVLVKKP